MRRCAVDTNVAIVANGQCDAKQKDKAPSAICRLAAIEFLENLLKKGRIVLDVAGDIQAEYHRHLSPRGQPGVGDRFYLEVLNSAPKRVDRVDLPKNPDGSYQHFPDAPELEKFDPSDRKFAALARKQKIPVANACDSDWLDHRAALEVNGVAVHFVCGCDRKGWFVP